VWRKADGKNVRGVGLKRVDCGLMGGEEEVVLKDGQLVNTGKLQDFFPRT